LEFEKRLKKNINDMALLSNGTAHLYVIQILGYRWQLCKKKTEQF